MKRIEYEMTIVGHNKQQLLIEVERYGKRGTS